MWEPAGAVYAQRDEVVLGEMAESATIKGLAARTER